MIPKLLRLSRQRTIQAGDCIIAYLDPRVMKAVYVSESDEHFDMTSGRYYPYEWIGKPFGICVYPKRINANTRPLFLLAPTPELWTKVLSHRTQILYVTDISMVCQILELRPGSLVLESGTGSGSASHSFIRAIAPTGHLYTFDFHEERVKKANEDFNKNSLSDFVSVSQRDIEDLGFPEEFKLKADAIFLDLPRPWKALKSAFESLREGGVLCSFSPCMEQVQKVVYLMYTMNFIEIRVMECISEEFSYNRRKLTTNVLYSGAKQKHEDEEEKDKNGEEEEEKEKEETFKFLVLEKMKGHSGYLAFANKFCSTHHKFQNGIINDLKYNELL